MRPTSLGRFLLFSLLAVFALTLLTDTALAAPTPGEHGAKAGEEHGSGGGLEFAGFKRYDLGIWTLVVFGLLMIILSKYAWPNIKEGLEKREQSIRLARDEAKQDRIDAEAKLLEAKRQLDEAALKAKTIVDEARKAADALEARAREAASKEAELRKQQAEREIVAYRDALLKDVYAQAVQLATLMSEKALRREVSSFDHNRLLDESLAEIQAGTRA